MADKKKKNSASIFDDEEEQYDDEEPAAEAEAPAETVPAEGMTVVEDPATGQEIEVAEGQTTEPAAVTDDHVLKIAHGGPGSALPEDMTAYEGEHMPALTGETWVILASNVDEVPERYWGALAAVIDPIPVAHEEDPVTGSTTYYTDPEAQLHVRERSQGAELWIPLTAVARVSLDGRATLHSVP